jgi:hypothetical protein
VLFIVIRLHFSLTKRTEEDIIVLYRKSYYSCTEKQDKSGERMKKNFATTTSKTHLQEQKLRDCVSSLPYSSLMSTERSDRKSSMNPMVIDNKCPEKNL